MTETNHSKSGNQIVETNKIIEANRAWIDTVWDKIDQKMSVTALRSRNKIPYSTVNGVHDDQMELNPLQWTNGFWGGLLWLMYIDTKKEVYRESAESAEKLMDKLFELYDELEHDVGFRWHITSGVNYRLTGNKQSRLRNIYAGNALAARFNSDGNYLIPFNSNTDGLTIIDTMMNISVLYWMSDELGPGEERYSRIAIKHADMSMNQHVRPDGSVNHTVFHDPLTGEPLYTSFGQGYADGSTWSRGQAWAIYGFVLSYIHTGQKKYLDTAKKTAHYFISCVCDDWLPKCDFRCPKEPVIYDSTAGAIAACGMIEIAKYVPEYEQDMYLNVAFKLLKALEENFCNWSLEEDSIVQMGTERYHGKNGKGIHIPIIYGDYFFIEALYKLRGNEFLSW